MTEDQIQNLINSMGALAEMNAVFYNQLKDAGFTEEQAMAQVLCLLSSMITRSIKEADDDD